MDRQPHRARVTAWWAALAGVVSVGLGLGIAELVAGLVVPTAGPVLVVGSAAIELAPAWAKDTAIALFGTGDKAALLVGIGLVLLLGAAGAGVLERRLPPWGRVLLLAGGVLGAIAAATRPESAVLGVLPALSAALVAVVALTILVRRVPEPDPRPGGPDRRQFLAWAGGAAAIGVLAAVAGNAIQAGARAATVVRDALVLPRPAVPAPAVPAGAELGIEGLAPVITPNADFYRIDIALQVPRIDPAGWKLRVHGDVDREIELGWDELLGLPLEESITTLACVSNEVGGDLIGTATWIGYPIRKILERAGPKAGADMVLSRSPDGFSASTPLDVLQDEGVDAILAVGMNGEPLPLEHGFPVRMVVPGLYGYVSATKWVTELEVTRFADRTAFWTDRGWSERGPVKLSSRIDVPRDRTVDAGRVVVAGVAWHQHVGIAGVEVQVDDGPWTDAELATAISTDTWVQWRWDWEAVSGSHLLRVRATGADGEQQSDVVRDVVPDGATGLHEVRVEVR